MSNILNSLLDLVFPPRCEVCRTSSQEIICSSCFKQIKFMKPHLGIYCVSIYDGVLREAIHRFKFKRRKKLAEPLGFLMVQYLSQLPLLEMEKLDAIVPVPLHRRRLRERGFNQAELLGNIVGKYFGLPLLPAVERTRDTQAQFDLPREKRFNNIAEAFSVARPVEIEGRRIMLIDDIYTTGATITECSRALKAAGAKRIEVATLSRAVED
jgi:ComF family protein